MKKHNSVLGLLLFVTSQVFAGQYVIQLDTSKSPDLKDFEELSIYGDLYTVEDANGYTKILLGPYKSEAIVIEALNEVHVAGHYAAHVSEYKSENVSSLMSADTKQQYSIANFDVKRLLDDSMLEKWNALTLQQQASITYLDGVLQIMDGNNYVSLKNFKASKLVSRFN